MRIFFSTDLDTTKKIRLEKSANRKKKNTQIPPLTDLGPNIRTELPEGLDERVDADGRIPVVKILSTH